MVLSWVAQSDASLTGDQEVAGLIPTRSGFFFFFFVEIDHEIFSMVMLPIPLIQEFLYLLQVN